MDDGGRFRVDPPFVVDPPLTVASPFALAGVPIPPRVWVVPGWLPAATVTLLYGAGGEGKTLLAQQLMTAVAAGVAWVGLPVNQGPALGLFSEDDEAEMHRRQDAINRALGIGYEDLADMWWTCPVGTDNTLLRFGPDGAPQQTERFRQFMAYARQVRPSVIVLDVAADLYGGNENDRGQVAQFLKATLGGLARDTGAAVLVNAHPSKSSIQSCDLDSGSTGWNGGVRTRLTLASPTAEEGEPRDETARILRRAKANYARRGDTVELVFRDGVLMPRMTLTGTVASLEKRKCEDVFLELLARLPAAGIRVSVSRNAGNYAPRIFSQRPDRQGFGKRDFEVAMQRLFADGRLRSEPYGKPSDRTEHLVAVVGDGPEEGGDG